VDEDPESRVTKPSTLLRQTETGALGSHVRCIRPRLRRFCPDKLSDLSCAGACIDRGRAREEGGDPTDHDGRERDQDP